MQKAKVRTKRAFTLVELLVVVSIIALLISILLPSLKKAREQTKAVVCLANQKGMSTAVLTYTSEYGGVLIGPLHPAVYQFQTTEKYQEYGIGNIQYNRDRQLTWVLRGVLGQKGGGERGENVADALSTCPAMAGYMSENHIKAYNKVNTSKKVFPTHYTINNWGGETVEGTNWLGNVRQTNPPHYFGWSPPTGNPKDPIPPQSLSRIKRTSDEWMLATAWYRAAAAVPITEFQQEGPYQSGWSGDAFPYFAPHFKTGMKNMYTDIEQRKAAARTVRNQKSDGKTNAVYMDGHGAMVSSKSFMYGNGFQILYGFQGTVNPRLSDQGKPIWDGGKWQ